MTDIFQHPDQWPTELANILNKYLVDDYMEYSQLNAMLKECEAIGYTFEYELDAVPFGLKKIEQ